VNIWWLIGAALFGVAAFSVYGAFHSPEFVLGLGAAMLVAAYKAIEPVLTKRMTPEQEKKMHECLRRGGEWDNARKKCRD
jgi:uncharacterized membrane protein